MSSLPSRLASASPLPAPASSPQFEMSSWPRCVAPFSPTPARATLSLAPRVAPTHAGTCAAQRDTADAIALLKSLPWPRAHTTSHTVDNLRSVLPLLPPELTTTVMEGVRARRDGGGGVTHALHREVVPRLPLAALQRPSLRRKLVIVDVRPLRTKEVGGEWDDAVRAPVSTMPTSTWDKLIEEAIAVRDQREAWLVAVTAQPPPPDEADDVKLPGHQEDGPAVAFAASLVESGVPGVCVLGVSSPTQLRLGHGHAASDFTKRVNHQG